MALYDKKGPIVVKEEPGVTFYCMCGLTEDAPYCDGSHNGQGTGKTPYIVRFKETKTVRICGCGKSEKLPYCDGAHGQDEK
ncbi:CDGSH iron-sulfur domain-containing protein [Brevibacillus laterosporus]|uniref:CDGSH iron-sulfur domain-containing protein n=1 Tax=Brevibacillus laterosporus TaxID=1465 RepID=UPI00215CEE52|nr:CDGSH iron-sulfur domain-containing protein [Brevibacillus laterosporus]MCR8996895.1 CDGSH iron-sulfur domain-containing protein [Brevibacillus laterosporus]